MFFLRRRTKKKSLTGFGTLRIGAALAINIALLAVIGYAFWLEDWRYSLPATSPEGLVQPPLGSLLPLPPSIAALKHSGRPLLMNFANPECPCTQFNLDHVRKLEQTFGSKVDFLTVLQSDSDLSEARAEFQSMHLRMPVMYDRGAKIGGLGGRVRHAAGRDSGRRRKAVFSRELQSFALLLRRIERVRAHRPGCFGRRSASSPPIGRGHCDIRMPIAQTHPERNRKSSRREQLPAMTILDGEILR